MNPNRIPETSERFDLPFKDVAEKFNEYFPDGVISEISLADMSAAAKEFLVSYRSTFLAPRNEVANPLGRVFRVAHNGGDVTYAATHEKNFNNPEHSVSFIYTYDERGDEMTGFAEAALDHANSDYFIDKPYIFYIETEEGFKQQGLGERKMSVLNACSRAMFGLPLYSGGPNSFGMLRRWSRLIQNGQAERVFTQGKPDRFRFL